MFIVLHVLEFFFYFFPLWIHFYLIPYQKYHRQWKSHILLTDTIGRQKNDFNRRSQDYLNFFWGISKWVSFEKLLMSVFWDKRLPELWVLEQKSLIVIPYYMIEMVTYPLVFSEVFFKISSIPSNRDFFHVCQISKTKFQVFCKGCEDKPWRHS